MIIVSDSASGESYAFGLDKIRGYRGEPLRAIGLRRGRTVRFSLTPDDRILEAELT